MAAPRLLVQTQLFNQLAVEVPPTVKVVDATAYRVEQSYKAEDVKTKREVSVERLVGAFGSVQTARQTLRELRLSRLCKHVNVVAVRGIFFDNTSQMANLYVVRNAMDCSLAQLISSPTIVTRDHAPFILYQIFKGMKFVHSAHIIHGDFQPDHVYLRQNGELTIGGLGINSVLSSSERWRSSGTGPWYCAPEVLGGDSRTTAMDVWAIACVYAEMRTGRPLFPGQGTLQHLCLVCGLLGAPTADELAIVGSCLRCASQQHLMEFSGPTGSVRELLDTWLSPASADESDLLSQMLRWLPSQRGDVSFLIEHRLLESWRDPEDEPTREPADAREFAFEAVTSLAVLRMEIYLEALRSHPEEMSKYEEELEADLCLISSIRKLSSSIRCLLDQSAALHFNMLESGPAATEALLHLVRHSLF